MQTVSDIIKACGGPAKIAAASKGVLKKDAVYKWPTIGVPDRHWKLLMKLAPDLTAQALFDANVKARKEPGRARAA